MLSKWKLERKILCRNFGNFANFFMSLALIENFFFFYWFCLTTQFMSCLKPRILVWAVVVLVSTLNLISSRMTGSISFFFVIKLDTNLFPEKLFFFFEPFQLVTQICFFFFSVLFYISLTFLKRLFVVLLFQYNPLDLLTIYVQSLIDSPGQLSMNRIHFQNYHTWPHRGH